MSVALPRTGEMCESALLRAYTPAILPGRAVEAITEGVNLINHEFSSALVWKKISAHEAINRFR